MCIRDSYGGARRDRTADLNTASVALSQLSYSPLNEIELLYPSKIVNKKNKSKTMKFYIKVALFVSIFNLSNITSADTDKNAELFGSLPDIYDVLISPNGKYIGVQQKTDETIIVKIIDLDKSALVNVHDFGAKGRISSFFWATDNRLVFSVNRPDTRSTANFNTGQLVAADIDGKNTRLIAGFGSAPDHLQGKRNRRAGK